MKKKISLILVLVLLLSTLLIHFVSASSINNDLSNYAIKEKLKQYFDSKESIFKDQKQPNLDNFFLPQSKTKVKQDKKFQYYLKDMKLKNRIYRDCQIELSFDDIKIVNNNAYVGVTEYMKQIHSDGVTTDSTIKHNITLSLLDDTWKIAEDIFYDDLDMVLEHTTYEELEKTTKKNYVDIKNLSNTPDENIERTMTTLTTGSYNRTNAYNYAYNNYDYTDTAKTKYNPYYINFEQYPGNYDCTNFIS